MRVLRLFALLVLAVGTLSLSAAPLNAQAPAAGGDCPTAKCMKGVNICLTTPNGPKAPGTGGEFLKR